MAAVPPVDRIEVVYRPKTEEERQRRVERANALVGTNFLHCPHAPHKVLFVARNGVKVRTEVVEMVYNDALTLDAISNWGEDGPLYRETLEDDLHREIFTYACKAYAAVTLPVVFKPPCCVRLRHTYADITSCSICRRPLE